MSATALLIGAVVLSGDSLRVRSLDREPVMDGRPSDAEYGAPTITLDVPSGRARIWLVRRAQHVYIAAELPDTSFYWGDDFVVSLDPDGSRGSSPGAGDRPWYLRRTLDSSTVVEASGTGRWEPRGGAQMIGVVRAGADWSVASTSHRGGWSLELRIDARLIAGANGRAAAIAFRTFDDKPAPTWTSWPEAPNGSRPTRVEVTPDLWVVVQ
jgi:hypothetical protein